MSEVKRYLCSGPWFTRDLKLCVLASDFDAKAAECERLAAALRKYGRHDNGALSYHPCKQWGRNPDLFPCTCGLDAALSAVPSDSPADVKTAPQMDLTKPVPTKAG